MFIDIHAHTSIYPRQLRPSADKGIGTPDELVRMWDLVGFSQGVIMPCIQPEGRATLQSNEDILQCAARHPDRFIPFCGIDPRAHLNSPDTDLSFVIKYYKDQGCRGVGEVIPNLPFADQRMQNLFHHVEKSGLPMTFHLAAREGCTYGIIDELGLPGLEDTLRRFSNLVILAHSQPFWSHISADVAADNWGGYPSGPVVEGGRVPELLRRYSNLNGDLSAGSGYNAVSRDPDFGYAFMTEFQDQLLFGTDCYKMEQRDELLIQLKTFMEEGLEAGRISQEVFDKITHKNAQRILKL